MVGVPDIETVFPLQVVIAGDIFSGAKVVPETKVVLGKSNGHSSVPHPHINLWFPPRDPLWYDCQYHHLQYLQVNRMGLNFHLH